jgi:MFS family permease
VTGPLLPDQRAAVQRRTLPALSAGVAIGGLGVTVGITVGGLLARNVAGTDAAGGLGQTASVLGAAVIAVPLARVSDRSGRRAGLALGYGIAVAGGLLVVAAAALSSLPLLLAGLFAFGAATTSGLQARYAAADLAGAIANDVALGADLLPTAPAPMAATVFGRAARRYAHLAVIDGGRPR